MFRLWLTMPTPLKQGTDISQRIDLGVPEYQLLIGIKTQRDFGKMYNINESTLHDWKVLPPAKGFEDITWQNQWAEPLIKDVALSLYAATMKSGDPTRVKLFFQLFGGFVETTHVEHPQAQAHFEQVAKILEKLEGDDDGQDGEISSTTVSSEIEDSI